MDKVIDKIERRLGTYARELRDESPDTPLTREAVLESLVGSIDRVANLMLDDFCEDHSKLVPIAGAICGVMGNLNASTQLETCTLLATAISEALECLADLYDLDYRPEDRMGHPLCTWDKDDEEEEGPHPANA